MANRTINRQPFSVPISKTKDGFFTHVNFKGLCDDKNDAKIDTETFADLKNVYVDENEILKSRPPFKFSTDVTNIIDQWMFGNVGLRLRRVADETNFTFILSCTTHDTVDDQSNGKYDEMSWSIVGTDIPKIKHVQIEDKIFIWFANDFICFNTSGFYFEYASKYLYIPIYKLAVNGIETDLEDKNFFDRNI